MEIYIKDIIRLCDGKLLRLEKKNTYKKIVRKD